MSKKIKLLIVAFLIWRLGLLLVSASADIFLAYRPSFPYAISLLAKSNLPRWLYSWGNFDGVHYLTIADKGYVGTGLIQAFFPIFPLMIFLMGLILKSDLLSALIISNLGSFILLFLFYKLVSRHFNDRVAWLSILVLLTFPTSFFWGSIYNESLFLSFVIASFLAADQKKWWLAGLLAALASSTRIVGICLIPALLTEFWLQEKNHSFQKVLKQWTSVLAIACGSLGLLSFMGYLNHVFQDPLYFLHVQAEFGSGRQESMILLPQVIFRYLKILLTARPFDLKYFSYVQELWLSLGALGLLIWSWWQKIPKSWLIFSISAFLAPTLTGTFSSMPRYILVCFPIYIAIALIMINKKSWQWLYFSISTLWLIFNTILFIQGYWVA